MKSLKVLKQQRLFYCLKLQFLLCVFKTHKNLTSPRFTASYGQNFIESFYNNDMKIRKSGKQTKGPSTRNTRNEEKQME